MAHLASGKEKSTKQWVNKLIDNYEDNKLTLLEGQVNLEFIIEAFKNFNFHQYKIILVHCENKVRHKRLHHNRNQPELINDKMDNWSNFLEKQAIDMHVTILNTTHMRIEEMLAWFKEYLKRINR